MSSSMPPESLEPPSAAYRKWVVSLASTGLICHGSVVSRTLRRRVGGVWHDKGPYYFWTCKVAGKTVCHALSQPQYEQLKCAIAANRRLMKTVAKMQATALDAILKNVPGVSKRK